MKRNVLTFLVVSAMISGLNAKEIKEVVFTPSPRMVCGNCEKNIKGNLRFEKGVKKIETDLEHQTITISYDADKTDPKKLEEALFKLKYEVEEIPSADLPTEEMIPEDSNR